MSGPDEFVASKRASWERLTGLLDRSGSGGVATLSAEEIYELGRLYRSATSDLAVARRDFATHRVVLYLNTLVGRAHGTIYRERAVRLSTIVTFFRETLPRAFRATWGYTLAAFLMCFLPAVLGFVLTLIDPSVGESLVPGSSIAIDNIRDGREWWLTINDDGRAASASLIMTKNIRVAVVAFAGGALLGTLTFWVLLQNGLLLGVVAGAAQHYGFSSKLWGFIVGHGVIELSVIFIAGGAGLQLAWAVLRPGLLTRRAALVVAARRAMHLTIGCVLLLVVAGTIEGFISPSALPLWVKICVGLGSGAAMYSYFILSGREPRAIAES